MLIEESRILQVSIFDTLDKNEHRVDLPRFSQPAMTGVSRFGFVGEYISPS